MKCPACAGVLKEKKQSDLVVDVCEQKCGGVWFDNRELQKVDEAHESLGEALLNLESPTPAPVDRASERYCPRCAQQPLFRHYFTVRQEVEVDDCPACGGVWLDVHELAAIRKEFKTEAERKQAGEQYFHKLFSKDLVAAAAQRETSVEQAQKFARALRFICPSYWIPGKQKWGAF